MPGFIMHQGATVTCMHGGQAQPITVSPRVKVMGQAVVTQSAGYTVSGCGLAASGSPPCVSAQWTTGATRVFSNGVPVLLQDSQAVCTPTGTGLNLAPTQTRVKAF